MLRIKRRYSFSLIYIKYIVKCIFSLVFNTFLNSSGCHLDENNYMPASHLRVCLNSLGGTGTRTIDYIETAHGDTYINYLNKVCNAIKPGFFLDRARTEAQPDVLYYYTYGVMYPSHCGYGWLGRGHGCNYQGYNANYDGFFCTGTLLYLNIFIFIDSSE